MLLPYNLYVDESISHLSGKTALDLSLEVTSSTYEDGPSIGSVPRLNVIAINVHQKRCWSRSMRPLCTK